MKQSIQNLCTVHQEVIDQKNDNDNDQCKTCMEIQYNNEIIKVEEATKEQQMIIENSKLNIYQQQQKFRKFNYQLLKKYPNNCYSSFVFNQDSTLLFVGGCKVIKVFKFKHGKKLLQKLTKHTQSIQSLIFMNKSNLLVSGSWDKSIIIWGQDYNSNLQPHQKLEGHLRAVYIIINNEDEDLLISGSIDKTIKFWRKTNMNWSCQQTIQTSFFTYSLSLNKVMELNSAQWYIIQKVQFNCNYGRQLCFISDSKFLFQGVQDYLEIYEYQQNVRSFIKEKTIGVQKIEDYSNFPYPCKYLESKGFVIIQHGRYLNFFGIDENQNCELSYSIDFNKKFIGNISNDGQFLVTRDRDCVMQIRKLNQLE